MKNGIRILGLITMTVTLAGCPTLGDTIHEFGFRELRPPSLLVPPGSIVTILSETPLTVQPVCAPGAAWGNSVTNLISPTKNLELSKKVSQSMQLDAKYLEQVKANAKFKGVSDVKLTLANDTVFAMTWADAVANVDNRSNACQKAIDAQVALRRKRTAIWGGLKADVNYVVTFDSDVQADVRADILKNLAAELGIENESHTSSTISGKGLFWGVQDDTAMAALRPGQGRFATAAHLDPRTLHGLALIPLNVSVRAVGPPIVP